jgi:hypothetical protein
LIVTSSPPPTTGFISAVTIGTVAAPAATRRLQRIMPMYSRFRRLRLIEKVEKACRSPRTKPFLTFVSHALCSITLVGKSAGSGAMGADQGVNR